MGRGVRAPGDMRTYTYVSPAYPALPHSAFGLPGVAADGDATLTTNFSGEERLATLETDKAAPAQHPCSPPATDAAACWRPPIKGFRLVLLAEGAPVPRLARRRGRLLRLEGASVPTLPPHRRRHRGLRGCRLLRGSLFRTAAALVAALVAALAAALAAATGRLALAAESAIVLWVLVGAALELERRGAAQLHKVLPVAARSLDAGLPRLREGAELSRKCLGSVSMQASHACRKCLGSVSVSRNCLRSVAAARLEGSLARPTLHETAKPALRRRSRGAHLPRRPSSLAKDLNLDSPYTAELPLASEVRRGRGWPASRTRRRLPQRRPRQEAAPLSSGRLRDMSRTCRGHVSEGGGSLSHRLRLRRA